MRVKALYTYQSIQVPGGSETFFPTYQMAHKKTSEIEFLTEYMCFSVKRDGEHFLIPLANIKNVSLWTEKDDKIMLDREEERKRSEPQPQRIKKGSDPR